MSEFNPSYFPEEISTKAKNLKIEKNYWSIDPSLVLSPNSAKAIIESHIYTNQLFDGNKLENIGLDKKLRGIESLKEHGNRVAILSMLIKDELTKRKSNLITDSRTLAIASILHDIGKLDPEVNSIVMYKGKIDRNDPVAWTIIKRHPQIGHDAVLSIMDLTESKRHYIAEAIRCHHEKHDGSGYYGISEDQTPIESKIISVSDAMDVMMGQRPYKKAMSASQTIEQLEKYSGSQFNEEIAETAIKIKPQSGNFVTYSIKTSPNFSY